MIGGRAIGCRIPTRQTHPDAYPEPERHMKRYQPTPRARHSCVQLAQSVCIAFVATAITAQYAVAQQLRVELQPKMVVNEAEVGDPSGLVDEQREIVGPPVGKPDSTWTLNSKYWKQFPFSCYLDLGKEKNLSSLWLFDTNGKGDVVISAGTPGQWKEVADYDCGAYLKWVEIKLDVTARYLRITRKTPGANFSEIAVYEYSDEAYQELLARQAEEARRQAEREAALAKAREEALRRPLIEMPPYGTLSLVDEIDCAQESPDHLFAQSPEKASHVETILGRQARVLAKQDGQASYFSYRIGKMKLLRPGAAYVLAVDYPEDAPRSMVIINTGNETSRGLHTGTTVGDALHAKYVNSLVESIDVPLSGKWETWSLLLRLHDRFPQRGLVRGPKPRPLTPEDGFDVTIAQFSAKNCPMSQGAAVSYIRLYEVVDPDKLTQPLTFPADGLPRRRLFWREEMADGIIDRKTDQPGIADPIDWYRNKAELMRFLGMNTYGKDLLEFGACQHWDPTPYGGNDWVFFDGATKDLWHQIVTLMGKYQLDVLPYYEYSGSKGYKGLGNQRRARPLTRDDAYSHISWIESANADITDPDTYEDFKRMLDLTVLRMRRLAHFAGIWIRPRSQMPVSFAEPTLNRFMQETGKNRQVTREMLRNDKALYDEYLQWWGEKRKAFLIAMRDYLRVGGVDNAVVLFTGCPAEPGVSFHTWDPIMVTDRPDLWKPILAQPLHSAGDRGAITPLTPRRVVSQDLYLTALTSPGLTWGNWEIQHSRPADDPQRYRDTDGILLTHAFNRNYTVTSPKTLEAFRTPTGLAIVRHYALNENMMFDKGDKELLGYFVVDVERAGPYCMMGEALAMANGDPTMIGYLVGANFGRGFPQYVRNFNANFLALPALPSSIVPQAASDPEVVVRQIRTDEHGTWLAVVNTSLHPKSNVTVTLPPGTARDAVSGQTLKPTGGKLSLDLYPCELRSLHIK